MPSSTFKRRIRERMERTGESYTTARAALIKEAEQRATCNQKTDRGAQPTNPKERDPS